MSTTSTVAEALTLLVDVLLLLVEILDAFIVLAYRCVFPKRRRSLASEVAVVTGAGHGIGKEFALQLGRMGASVACWDIDADSCKQTRQEIEEAGGTARDFQCDVSRRQDICRAAHTTRDAFGEVTLLVNNAGVMPAKPFLHLTEGDIDTTFKVNVYSQFWMLLEFLPEMVQMNRGHVIAMSSTAGIVGTPYLTAYCASKFANKGMMDALFLEQMKERPCCQVKMTTVHPITVDTGLAHAPTTRFPRLVPIVSAEECARTALDAARRGEEEVFVPRYLQLAMRAGKCLPRKAQLALVKFLGVGVGHKEPPAQPHSPSPQKEQR